jgi:hypothetical protein
MLLENMCNQLGYSYALVFIPLQKLLTSELKNHTSCTKTANSSTGLAAISPNVKMYRKLSLVTGSAIFLMK